MKKNIYLVTGGMGHLGSTLIKALISRGERNIRALVLREDEGECFDEVSYFSGDVRDKESMRPFFEHTEDEEIFLVHTASLISIQRKGMKDLYEVNVGGTENIIELAREYGVKKLVYVSSVHAIEERKDISVQREAESYDPESVYGEYAKSKAIAGNMVLDAAREGLFAMVVLPSGIIGPGDRGRNHLVQLCQMFLSNHLPLSVRGGYDMVDVRDVADGIIKALEKGKSGESYILSGSSVSIREMLGYMASCSSRKNRLCIPIFLARIVSPFFELDAKRKKKRPLFTRYSLMTLKSNTRFSHDKASVELGYRPRDISESVRDMVFYLQRINRLALNE